jgi:hypothetical protein
MLTKLIPILQNIQQQVGEDVEISLIYKEDPGPKIFLRAKNKSIGPGYICDVVIEDLGKPRLTTDRYYIESMIKHEKEIRRAALETPAAP